MITRNKKTRHHAENSDYPAFDEDDANGMSCASEDDDDTAKPACTKDIKHRIKKGDLCLAKVCQSADEETQVLVEWPDGTPYGLKLPKKVKTDKSKWILIARPGFRPGKLPADYLRLRKTHLKSPPKKSNLRQFCTIPSAVSVPSKSNDPDTNMVLRKRRGLPHSSLIQGEIMQQEIESQSPPMKKLKARSDCSEDLSDSNFSIEVNIQNKDYSDTTNIDQSISEDPAEKTILPNISENPVEKTILDIGRESLLFEDDCDTVHQIYSKCTQPRQNTIRRKIFNCLKKKKSEFPSRIILGPSLLASCFTSLAKQRDKAIKTKKLNKMREERAAKETNNDHFFTSCDVNDNYNIRLMYRAIKYKILFDNHADAEKMFHTAIKSWTDDATRILLDDRAYGERLRYSVAGLWCVYAQALLDDIQSLPDCKSPVMLNARCSKRSIKPNLDYLEFDVFSKADKKKKKNTLKTPPVKQKTAGTIMEEVKSVLERGTKCPFAGDNVWPWIARSRLMEHEGWIKLKSLDLDSGLSLHRDILLEALTNAKHVCQEALLFPEITGCVMSGNTNKIIKETLMLPDIAVSENTTQIFTEALMPPPQIFESDKAGNVDQHCHIAMVSPEVVGREEAENSSHIFNRAALCPKIPESDEIKSSTSLDNIGLCATISRMGISDDRQRNLLHRELARLNACVSLIVSYEENRKLSLGPQSYIGGITTFSGPLLNNMTEGPKDQKSRFSELVMELTSRDSDCQGNTNKTCVGEILSSMVFDYDESDSKNEKVHANQVCKKNDERNRILYPRDLLKLTHTKFLKSDAIDCLDYLLELYSATQQNVQESHSVKRCQSDIIPTFMGQVGLRCLFCRNEPFDQRALCSTVCPRNVSQLNAAFWSIFRHHVCECALIPNTVRDRCRILEGATDAGDEINIYWSRVIKENHLTDRRKQGIVIKAIDASSLRSLVTPSVSKVLTRLDYIVLEQFTFCANHKGFHFDFPVDCKSKQCVNNGNYGLICRHCGVIEKKSVHIYEPTRRTSEMRNHVLECEECPTFIKKHISSLVGMTREKRPCGDYFPKLINSLRVKEEKVSEDEFNIDSEYEHENLVDSSYNPPSISLKPLVLGKRR